MNGPEPQSPRVYELSGDAPSVTEPASVALAVLGEMLTEAERAYRRSKKQDGGIALQLDALREARRRVSEAESAL